MSDGAYTTATVKSNAEFDKNLSPLSLELADRIKALPKFCDREAIAAIIEPYVSDWLPISTAPKNGTHIQAADFRPGQVGFGGNPQQAYQCIVHWFEWGDGTHTEESGFYPSTGAGENPPLTNLTHWKPLKEKP